MNKEKIAIVIPTTPTYYLKCPDCMQMIMKDPRGNFRWTVEEILNTDSATCQDCGKESEIYFQIEDWAVG